ncbi:MAG: efflux RND transporter periplasmic adaptor subunit [Polyangia bacterium]|jgi:cobalt-zinc-cadmium efflux system membrane fusion protein
MSGHTSPAFARAALLFALFGVAGCGKTAGRSGAPSEEPSLFEVSAAQRARLSLVSVEKKPVALPIEVPALVDFNQLRTSHVMALVSGKVDRVLAHEGDRVKAGQPLLSIASPDSSDTAANLERDRSALSTKRVILARDTDLYAHKAISLEELQQAQLDVTSAKATLADDQAHAAITGGSSSRAILRAPITGIIADRGIAVGEAVQAGTTPCFTVTDPSAVWIVAQLYQQDLRQAALGDTAIIRSPVLQAPLEGRIIYIGSSIDSDTLTIPVRIAADNPDALLKKGMYVSAEIIPAKPTETMLLPADAILHDEDNLPFVYVEASAGRFARRHVDLGVRVGDDFSILSGLKDGEKVLGSGAVFVQFADSLER